MESALIRRDVVAGIAAIVVAAFAAVAVYPQPDPAGRLLIVAVASGMHASVCRSWRARVVTAVVAVIAFVAFLDVEHGWAALSFSPAIFFAAVVGAGYRRIRMDELGR